MTSVLVLDTGLHYLSCHFSDLWCTAASDMNGRMFLNKIVYDRSPDLGRAVCHLITKYLGSYKIIFAVFDLV